MRTLRSGQFRWRVVGRRAARILLVLAAAVVLLAAAVPLRAASVRRAVVVGISEYQHISDLSYCHLDAIEFRGALLVDPQWSSSNITLLTNSQATKANIEAAVTGMVAASDADDVCVLYFSGHGTNASDTYPYDETDGLDEYVCAYDSSLYSYDYDISDDELAGWMSGNSAIWTVVILDTCHSGGFIEALVRSATSTDGAAEGGLAKTVNFSGRISLAGDGMAPDLMLAGAAEPPATKHGTVYETKDLQTLPRIVVLTASAADEVSYEYPEGEHGAFSFFVLEAFTASLGDQTGDGYLSGEEIFVYAAPRTGAVCADEYVQEFQTPQLCDNVAGSSFFCAAGARGPATVIHSVNMDTDPGWTCEGQWAWGQPLGLGGEYGRPDPSFGYGGYANVYGYNLSGDYASNMGWQRLTSTPFDCTRWTNVHLRFRRWLGVEGWFYDEARIRASSNGVSWTTIWRNPENTTSDGEWILYEYDISAVADRQQTVYLRWVMGSTDDGWTYCGWNIDDVELRGDPVPPQPLTVSAATGQWDWTYQNTVATTGGRHLCVLTVTVDDDPNENDSYTVQVVANGASTGVVVIEPTADPLVWNIKGGQAGTDPAGPVQLDVTVTGAQNGGQGTTSAAVTVRRLGDVDGSGGDPVALDKQNFNKRLNGIPTGLPDRAFDLNASGGEPNAVDKQIMNQLLNGVALP